MSSRTQIRPARDTNHTRAYGLDGLRGLFMVLFMAYHFGIHAMTGAWIGMNLFFLLSAYLIVSLLIREQARTGRLRIMAFYHRRARRLLPALAVVMAAVAVYSVFWQNPIDRRQTGGDLVATGGFFLNWRLVDRADEYFADVGSASLLRHLWTLSVEEQFYLVIPLILAALWTVRSRRLSLVVFLMIMSWSLWRMMTIGVGTVGAQAHAYYGTDTRVQAFALGAAMALWAPLGGPQPRVVTPRRVRGLGVVGLVITTIGFFVLAPMSEFMFEQGGMLLFNLAGAALVLSAAQRTDSGPARWLGRPVFAWLGARSYGLYLWHWPVALVLARALPELPLPLRVIVASVLTVALAAASYRWVERPMLVGGWPRRYTRLGPTILTSGTAVVVCVLTVALVRTPTSSVGPVSYEVPVLLAEDGPYRPGDQRIRVGIVGDSVAHGLHRRFPAQQHSDIELIDLTVPGCDFSGLTPAGFNAGPIAPVAGCESLLFEFADRIRTERVDVVLMLGLQSASLPHFDDDGHLLAFADDEYLDRLAAGVDLLWRQARDGGAQQFAIATVPCRFGANTPQVGLPEVAVEFMNEHPKEADDFSNPVPLNRWIDAWAAGRQIPVLDLYAALGCHEGFQPRIHGVELYEDLLHFTPEASAMLWTWLAPRARALADTQDTAG